MGKNNTITKLIVVSLLFILVFGFLFLEGCTYTGCDSCSNCSSCSSCCGCSACNSSCTSDSSSSSSGDG